MASSTSSQSARAKAETLMTQLLDDDENGSFVVIREWNEQDDVDDQTSTSSSWGRVVTATTDDKQEGDEGGINDECDVFSDASAGSSETLVNHNGLLDSLEMASSARTLGAAAADEGLSRILVINEEGDGTLIMDDEQFSMTNYSSTSSQSTSDQMDELQAKLNQSIASHKNLKELVEQQNMELEQRKVTIEDLKDVTAESVLREQQKSDEARRIIERLTVERDDALQKLTDALSSRGVESAVEHLEQQLKQREQIIEENGNQIKVLSTRLHEGILECEQLKELLRMKEEDGKVKNDSLSSSDEALAKSLGEKDQLQQSLQEMNKVKEDLEKEISDLVAQEEEVTKILLEEGIAKEKVEKNCMALDKENRSMRVMLATLEAENQISSTMVRSLTKEKDVMKRDLDSVSEMLNQRTTELRNLQEQKRSSNRAPGAGSVGSLSQSVIGGLMRPFKSYGLRDESDDPNEPFQEPEPFEHMGATGTTNTSQSQQQQTNAPSVEQKQFQCPICLKRFDKLDKITYHAANCGIDSATNTDPFVFP